MTHSMGKLTPSLVKELASQTWKACPTPHDTMGELAPPLNESAVLRASTNQLNFNTSTYLALGVVTPQIYPIYMTCWGV